jgi:hypothetical protein
VPVYSVFRGKIGAVDQYLAREGRLVLLESVEEVRTKLPLVRRTRPSRPQDADSTTLNSIVAHIVSILPLQRAALRDVA